jgi:outer membrane scaffolding protein for murein synthesis (MipA/OmpV family)
MLRAAPAWALAVLAALGPAWTLAWAPAWGQEAQQWQAARDWLGQRDRPVRLALGPAPLVVEPASPEAARGPQAFAPRQGFELNLGVGPLLYPTYQGARVSRAVPFPFIGGGYGDRVEFDALDGVRVTALAAAGFSVGAAARYRFGRRLSDDRAQLQGLRQFHDTIEAGGFVAYEYSAFYADATLTQDVARTHRGAVLDGRALLSLPLGPVGISAGPTIRTVSRPFAQAYYGIEASRAVASGRPAYSAGAGLERAGGLVVAEWHLTERLALRGFVEYGRLLGSAADSPLVRGRGGSADQVYAAVFLTWRLW